MFDARASRTSLNSQVEAINLAITMKQPCETMAESQPILSSTTVSTTTLFLCQKTLDAEW